MSHKEETHKLDSQEGQGMLREAIGPSKRMPVNGPTAVEQSPKKPKAFVQPKGPVITSNTQSREEEEKRETKLWQRRSVVARLAQRGLTNSQIEDQIRKKFGGDVGGASLVADAKKAGYDIPSAEERRKAYWSDPEHRKQAGEAGSRGDSQSSKARERRRKTALERWNSDNPPRPRRKPKE